MAGLLLKKISQYDFGGNTLSRELIN